MKQADITKTVRAVKEEIEQNLEKGVVQPMHVLFLLHKLTNAILLKPLEDGTERYQTKPHNEDAQADS